MASFGIIYAAAFVLVYLWGRIPADKFVRPPVKFQGPPCGPWAYFADAIAPRQFEAWKPPEEQDPS